MAKILKLIMKESAKELKEAFRSDSTYRIKTVTGKEYNWKPSKDYYTQEFIDEVRDKFPDIKNIEDIETTEELDIKESVVLRDAGAKLTDETPDVNNSSTELIEKEEHSFQEIIDMMSNATDYSELYDAASHIANEDLRTDVEQLIGECEDDGDDVETAYSVVTSDLLDSMINELNEDAYITINDGQNTEPDYLIQDVTELQDLNDEDVESPSIDGLLSLVNESLSNKYGNTWGYIKAQSIAKKESLQYAIIDIVTPSILKEADAAKIKDKAVSKTVILENVPNSRMINLKINTLAGTTRFSQKTTQPSKVLTRWLESEYLYDEMVEEFQKRVETRQLELKDTIETFLAQHPDLATRINTMKAQIELLKQAKMLDESRAQIEAAIYGLAAEFPANTNVKLDKNNKVEEVFNTNDEIVKILFGEEFVKDTSKSEKDLAKKNKDTVKKAQKESSLKEGYENFQIGEIEGTFNPVSMEAMYSIPSKNIKDKKINLTKIPPTDTPYDTDTIIRNYIETNYGQVGNDETEVDIDTNIEAPVENPDSKAPKDREVDETELDVETKEELNEDVQSETGTASFYKVRQREAVNIDDLINKSSEGANAQESDYIVVKEENLDEQSMNDLLSDLSKPQAFLQNIEAVDRKNYPFNVVKVASSSSPYTLLIDPVGYSYPRYISLSQK